MRLSNFFIYGSVTIIVAASLGFLIFKAMPGSNGDAKELAKKIKSLEKDHEDLLNESGKTVHALSEKINSLNDDLNRASKLLTEKDAEITKLQRDPNIRDQMLQLSRVLNCQPEQIGSTIKQLVENYQTLQRKYQIINTQISQQQGNSVPASGGKPENGKAAVPRDGDQLSVDSEMERKSDAPPRIKKMELAAPENKWANRRNPGHQNNDPQNPQRFAEATDLTNNQRVEGSKSITATDNSVRQASNDVPIRENEGEGNKNTTSITATEYQKLLTRIKSLEADLRNREKLLHEQTSLIEDLKQKSRIETGFRSSGRSNETRTTGVPANLPFRDRGTFPVQDR